MYNGNARAATMARKNPCKVLRKRLPQMKRECKFKAENIALNFTFPVKVEEIRTLRLSKKVPSSRHVRMDGTHTGKFGAESVRAALRRVRGSASNFVPRGSGGEVRPVDEAASRRWRSAPVFASGYAPRKPVKRKRVRGKEFLSRDCAQKWVPPKAWRFSPR